MNSVNQKVLLDVRSASRSLVRKLGFMNRTLAGTNYSPSAVHAIIEIGEAGVITGKRLVELLYLEKSTVSRLIQNLIKHDEVEEKYSKTDARRKNLMLTTKGQKTLAQIHAFGTGQVGHALKALVEDQQKTVKDGLLLYANALTLQNETQENDHFSIEEGYRSGLVGRITSLHATIYSKIAGFDQFFEQLVAGNFANFIGRLEHPDNQTWYALQNGLIIGGIAIDGEDLEKGQAHLRWFIVDDTIQSKGVGSELIQKAMEFCERGRFDEVHLWTFKGLLAARKLYERHGFELVEEQLGNRYGKEVLEQRFVRLMRVAS